jgi:3-keto-5-aminohexanoate cleavage enzyme
VRGHRLGRPDPQRRPNLPVTPEAIIDASIRAWRAGATLLHLHAREDDGTPTQDRDAFARLVDGIRAAGCDAVLNLSCGTAGGRAERDDRLAPLELKPEMASFDAGTINFGERIFEGDLPFLRRMAEAFRRSGVRPELECFDTGHVGLALQLQREGLLSAGPLVVQFVLGVPGTGVRPPSARSSICAASCPPTRAGSSPRPAPPNCDDGLLHPGGRPRPHRPGGQSLLPPRRAGTNAQLVERVVRLAAELERPVADAAQTRALLARRRRRVSAVSRRRQCRGQISRGTDPSAGVLSAMVSLTWYSTPGSWSRSGRGRRAPG